MAVAIGLADPAAHGRVSSALRLKLGTTPTTLRTFALYFAALLPRSRCLPSGPHAGAITTPGQRACAE